MGDKDNWKVWLSSVSVEFQLTPLRLRSVDASKSWIGWLKVRVALI